MEIFFTTNYQKVIFTSLERHLKSKENQHGTSKKLLEAESETAMLGRS